MCYFVGYLIGMTLVFFVAYNVAMDRDERDRVSPRIKDNAVGAFIISVFWPIYVIVLFVHTTGRRWLLATLAESRRIWKRGRP